MVAIIWGSGFVGTDIALTYFTPIEILSIRFCIAAVVMSTVFWKTLLKADKKNIQYGVILGCLLYGGFLLQTVGLQFTTPAKNAFLTAVNVVIVPFIGLFLFKRKLDVYSILGAFLAMIGIGVISMEGRLTMGYGDFLSLLCAIAFAFHIFLTGEFLNRNANPLLLATIQMMTAFLISILVLGFNFQPKEQAVSMNALLAMLYLSVVCTSLAFFLQTVSQKYTTETKAAIILCMEAVFGAIFSVILLREQLSLRTVTGCVIIFASIIIAETKLGKVSSKSI